jgi:hypothetical protein
VTALDDAAQAVAEARRDVHEFFVLLAATEADRARAVVARFEAAVRHHDAEVVRAYKGALNGSEWPDFAASLIHREAGGDAPPEVEVRYVGGPTIRIAGFSVTTGAETGLVVVEGFITSRTGQPRSGDAVRLAYLGIPGRGALADITASVELSTRLTVLNIRIRTTIRPEATP